MKAILENPSLMRAMRRAWGAKDPTVDKICAIQHGRYEAPDEFDDLEFGISGCKAVIEDARPSDEERAMLVRWIAEASALLTTIRTTSAKPSDDR